MKSERLDNMPIADVISSILSGYNCEYWVRVARVKLNEYKRDMPRLSQIINVDWKANHQRWTNEVDRAERLMIDKGCLVCEKPTSGNFCSYACEANK